MRSSRNLRLINQDLRHSGLDTEDLRSARLDGSDLRRVNHTHSLLAYASLVNTNLLGVNFGLDSAFAVGSDELHCLAVSSDSTLIATPGTDMTVSLWDTVMFQQVKSLSGHCDSILALEFSPQGKILASSGLDLAVMIWDTDMGTLLSVLEECLTARTHLCFLADTAHLVGAGDDEFVVVWDIESTAILQELRIRQNQTSSLSLTPNNKQLICGHSSVFTVIPDLDAFDSFTEVEYGAWGYHSVSVSPDGKLFAFSGTEPRIALYDTAESVIAQRLVGHVSTVSSTAFSLDGQYLVSGGMDSSVILWELATAQPMQVVYPHSSRVTAVVFAPNNQWFVSGGRDGDIAVCKPQHQRRCPMPSNEAKGTWGVCLSPNRELIARGTTLGTVTLWSLAAAAVLKEFNLKSELIETLAFSSDSELLAVGCTDGLIEVWSITGTEPLIAFNCRTQVNNLCFSPDKSCLAVASQQGLEVWNLSAAVKHFELEPIRKEALKVVYSPDGAYFCVSYTTAIYVVYTRSQQFLYSISDGLPRKKWTCFMSDSTAFATDKYPASVQLVETATGTVLKCFSVYPEESLPLAFSCDNKLLAVGVSSFGIIFLDVKSGECLKHYDNDKQIANAVFADDNSLHCCVFDQQRVFCLRYK